MGPAPQPRPADHAPGGTRLLVLVNPASGAASRDPDDVAARIGRALAAAGREADVRPVEPAGLAAAVRSARDGYEAIVIAGGDGSVSTAAGVLAGTGTALGVLPLGTLNHFARDLGMPTDLEAAVAALAGGTIARVDVGEVNGRLFVNNSSVGIYTAIVADRDRQRRERDRRKWLALAIATVRAVRHYRQQRLTIGSGGRRWRGRTSLLFIGNNRYQLEFPYMGARPRLDGGELCLFAILGRGWRLVRLAFLVLAGTADADREFEHVEGLREVTVMSTSPALTVAVDGEVERMRTPLQYRIRPLDLMVMRPAPPREASASEAGLVAVDDVARPAEAGPWGRSAREAPCAP